MLENVIQEYLKKKHATPYRILHLPPSRCKITLFLDSWGKSILSHKSQRQGKKMKI